LHDERVREAIKAQEFEGESSLMDFTNFFYRERMMMNDHYMISGWDCISQVQNKRVQFVPLGLGASYKARHYGEISQTYLSYHVRGLMVSYRPVNMDLTDQMLMITFMENGRRVSTQGYVNECLAIMINVDQYMEQSEMSSDYGVLRIVHATTRLNDCPVGHVDLMWEVEVWNPTVMTRGARMTNELEKYKSKIRVLPIFTLLYSLVCPRLRFKWLRDDTVVLIAQKANGLSLSVESSQGHYIDYRTYAVLNGVQLTVREMVIELGMLLLKNWSYVRGRLLFGRTNADVRQQFESILRSPTVYGHGRCFGGCDTVYYELGDVD